MEDYIADDQLPVEKCIEDVERCDFYMLILGNRYGFIPADAGNFKNPARESITHLEYRAAERTQKKVFAFVADPGIALKGDDGDSGELQEWKQKQLTSFRNEVRNKRLTHLEEFTSDYHLGLMVAESMIKANDKYAHLLPQLVERYIDEKRLYCLDRANQFNEYKYARIKNKSPFKAIISIGSSDTVVESLQARITEVLLNLDPSRVIKASLNDIFGSRPPEQYEEAMLAFLNVKFEDVFRPVSSVELKSVEDFVEQVKASNDCRMAFIIQWENLLDGDQDPRIPGLQNMIHEFYQACRNTGCDTIFFFINIKFQPEDEKKFDGVVSKLLEKSPTPDSYIVALSKLSKVPSEDLGIWLDHYVTDDPFKKDSIIDTYLNDLRGHFTMKQAYLRIRNFIRKVNAKDPEALQILN